MIKVNTSVLESSGSWVTVSWSGVSNSKKKDWIGVFSPPVNNSIDPATYAPVKYQVCSAISNNLVNGKSLKRNIYRSATKIFSSLYKSNFC